jgi:hypothetical protein
MAQTGFTPIQLYRSATGGNEPSPSDLTDGELALNYEDEKLFFKNAGGTVKVLAASNFVDQTGAAVWLTSVSGTNTITATATPVPAAYVAGMSFRFVAANSNTGAVTINIDSLGAKAITKNGSTPLGADDILAGAAVTIIYDGTEFQLSAGAGAGNSGANGVMLINKTEVTADYTLPAGSNALSVGPVTIDDGVEVVISDNQRWLVL